jgi:hypothetical protein
MSNISINEIKLFAKGIKKKDSISHGQALEQASQHFGFQSYYHARKELSGLVIHFCMNSSDVHFVEYDEKIFQPVNAEDFEKIFELFKEINGVTYTEEEFFNHFDYTFLKLNLLGIKNYKQAIDKIREVFFFPPIFLIHDFQIIDLSNYLDSDIDRKFIDESSTDREKSFDEDINSPYLWCLHCERTYKRGQYKLVGGLQLCPYSDCDGSTVVDGWDWQSIRENHSDYPEIPEKGNRYPMYS